MRLLIAVEHSAFGDERAEFLHQIQRKRGTTVESGLMVEAHIRIEAHGECRDGAVLGQQAVGEREQRVHWIGGRTACALGEVEGELVLGLRRLRALQAGKLIVIGTDLDHASEVLEIHGCGRAFHAQEFAQIACAHHARDLFFELLHRRAGRVHMQAHQHGALVLDLPLHHTAREGETSRLVIGRAELLDAGEDVLQSVAACEPIRTIRPC